MQSRTDIQMLLASHNASPKRSLGQNFLVDHNMLRKLIDASDLSANDTVLEVGPGTGTLTEEILKSGAKLIACELDDTLVKVLADRFSEQIASGQLTIIHGDCLETPKGEPKRLNSATTQALGDGAFKLVANLPYSSATPLLSDLLLFHPQCSLMAVTVQRELVDRLAATPKSREYGAIAVIASTFATTTRLATLPGSCFWPAPEVTSAMALLTRRSDAPTLNAAALSDGLRKIFAGKRKQLGSVLKGAMQADATWPAGIVSTDRAQSLSPEQLVALALLIEAAED